MKYAIINDESGSVREIHSDSKAPARTGRWSAPIRPHHLPAGHSLVEISNDKADQVAAADSRCFLIDGEVVTQQQIWEANKVPVLGAVKKYTFHKRLKAMGYWNAFNTEIKKTEEIKDLYDNSHELDINDPDVIELSPLIKIAVGVTDEEYNSLFEV
tara:strand:- start:6709 stop:7179 length:471 start_codon:yes stop_codon:yes gene_type:complete